MPEQLEIDLNAYITRPINFIDCEDYCTNDDCTGCSLCSSYEGEHKAEIMASVEEWLELIGKIF